MSTETLKQITADHLEKVAILIYQYDYPKDRDLPFEELRHKALARYHNYPLTQKTVRDIVALNLQTLREIESDSR